MELNDLSPIPNKSRDDLSFYPIPRELVPIPLLMWALVPRNTHNANVLNLF